MYTKLALSLERLAGAGAGGGEGEGRCGCISLRTGSVLTGTFAIVYSVLGIGLGLAALQEGAAEGVAEAGGASRAGVVCALVVQLLLLVLSALMVVGAITERVWLVRGWVVVKAAQVCVATVVFVAGGAVRLSGYTDDTHPVLLLAQFLSILLWVYLLTVVARFARHLDARAECKRLRDAVRDARYTDI